MLSGRQINNLNSNSSSFFLREFVLLLSFFLSFHFHLTPSCHGKILLILSPNFIFHNQFSSKFRQNLSKSIWIRPKNKKNNPKSAFAQDVSCRSSPKIKSMLMDRTSTGYVACAVSNFLQFHKDNTVNLCA